MKKITNGILGHIAETIKPENIKAADLDDFLYNDVWGKKYKGSHYKSDVVGQILYFSDNAIQIIGPKSAIIVRDAYVSMGLGNAVEFDELVAWLKAWKEKE